MNVGTETKGVFLINSIFN